jgi:hypothetical protein
MNVARISDDEFDGLITTFDLSDYQRWSYSIAQPMVDAGEDIRWVPRRLVSSVAIPGNDFYLLDNRLVVFLTYSGSGLDAGKFTSSDPADIQLCRSSFDAVWELALPHRDYRPPSSVSTVTVTPADRRWPRAGPASGSCLRLMRRGGLLLRPGAPRGRAGRRRRRRRG